MGPGNNKRPDTEIVHLFVTHNVVRTVKSNDGGQKSPCPEGSSTQVGDLGGRSIGVHFLGETQVSDQVVLG